MGTIRDITERKRAEEATRIQRDLAVALSAAASLDETLRLCVDAAIRASGMDCGGMYLVDRSSGALALACHQGLPPDFVKSASHYDADAANTRLVMAGKPTYSRHHELGLPLDEARRRQALRAIAVVPVRHSGEVIACLNVASHTLDDVPIACRCALETVAAQVGSAIARSRAEQALRESEEKFHSLFEHANDSIFISDPATRGFLDVNENAARRLGYTREELLQLTIDDIAAPVAAGRIDTTVEQLREAGSIVFEHVQRRKDGTEMPVEISSRVVAFGGRQVIQSFVRDITERKQAEETLRKSERELAIRNKIAHIFLTTPDVEVYGEVLHVVLEALESKHGLFGYIDEDGAMVCPSITRDIWDQCQIPDKDIVFPRETWGGIWGRALTEKKSLYSNGPLHVPEGHIPVHRALVAPIVHQGELIGNLHVANKANDYDERDQRLLETIADSIAPILHARLQRDRYEKDRRRAEEALRESEELLRTVIANAPVILFATDGEGVVTLNEGQGLATLGVGPGEHIGRSMFDLYRNLPEFTQDLRRALAGEALTTTVARAGMAYEAHLAPVRDDGGRVSGLIGVAIDVTERHQAEQALRESEKRFRDVLDVSRDLIYKLNLETGTYDYVSPSALELLGFAPEEVIAMGVEGVDKRLHPDDRPRLKAMLDNLLSGSADVGLVPTTEYRWQSRSGEYRWVSDNRTLVSDEHGRPVAIVGAIRDVTERARADEELRRLNELKSDFIALVSHELRAPLTSLSGGLELIAQDAPSLPPRAQRALAILSQECARLTALVESTLDMTRLDAGQLPLTFGPVWLAPLIAEAAASVANAGSHHPVDVRVPPRLPPAWADEVYLEQVVRNILSNAVKYSAREQPIIIEARAQGDSLIISVTDRGPGVSRAEQQHIFDAFYRGVGDAQSPAGYGLGLYFARKLIEAQGGAIDVESPAFDDPVAPGTTFTVRLPVADDEG